METEVQAELDMLKNIIINTVPTKQILLFGSYANGTSRKDSDLDLYVILKDDAPMRELEAGLKIRFAIDPKKSLPVDILVRKYTDYIERKKKPSLERKIAREGICIYG